MKAATVLTACIIVAIMAGCRATAPQSTSSGPDAIFLAPEYPALRLETLGYLGLASLVPDAVAIETTDALLLSYLAGGQDRFIILDPSSVRARAKEKGLDAQFDRAVANWKDRRTIDALQLKELGEKVGIDGFITADLSRWRKEQVDWTSEGNSFTEIGLELSIFDASTGVLAWKGEKMERRESPHYRHGRGVGSGVYSDGDVERTERAERLTPPPPPAEEVAESVVQALLSGLPPKPDTAAPLP
jgi:hypothetical protein